MNKTRRTIIGFVAGFLAIAAIASMGVLALFQSAAPAAKAAAAATNTPVATTTVPKAEQNQQVLDSFVKDFASHLNVSETQFNSAFSATVSDMADQMVKSGQLNQSQADMLKKFTANGIDGLMPMIKAQMGQMSAKGSTGMPGISDFANQGKQFMQPVIQAAADSLKLTPDQLQSQLMAGKSLTDLAASQNVDIQKVKDAILSAGKTQLNAAVTSGKLTQAQADKAYQTATIWIDEIVTAHKGNH